MSTHLLLGENREVSGSVLRPIFDRLRVCVSDLVGVSEADVCMYLDPQVCVCVCVCVC